jgi:hypothetical protein
MLEPSCRDAKDVIEVVVITAAGVSQKFSVPSTATVLEVKHALEREQGTEPRDAHLFSSAAANGDELLDSEALRDMQHESKVVFWLLIIPLLVFTRVLSMAEKHPFLISHFGRDVTLIDDATIRKTSGGGYQKAICKGCSPLEAGVHYAEIEIIKAGHGHIFGIGQDDSEFISFHTTNGNIGFGETNVFSNRWLAGVFEPAKDGDTIGMLVDFNHKSLTIFKNGRRMGAAVVPGLSGEYYWYAELMCRGDSLRIREDNPWNMISSEQYETLHEQDWPVEKLEMWPKLLASEKRYNDFNEEVEEKYMSHEHEAQYIALLDGYQYTATEQAAHKMFPFPRNADFPDSNPEAD